MDDDGFAVHSPRRRYSNREPARERDRATFLREVPKFAGTSEEFDRAHAKRYGREEGLGPDGRHSHRQMEFAHGSDRQKLYDRYDASTKPSNRARRAYETGLTAAKNEYVDMNKEEQDYYEANTGGLRPDQHELLDPRAKDWRDKCGT